MTIMKLLLPSGQNRQKNSLKERVFVNSTLKILCHIVKIHSYRLLFFKKFKICLIIILVRYL